MSSNLTSSAKYCTGQAKDQTGRCTIDAMKLLLAIYFFILAIIQMGLFFGVYHYYRTQNSVRPSLYWMSSLLISMVALLVFGAGVLTIEVIARPQFNFTVANALFIIAGLLQVLFCRSLNENISKPLKVSFFIGMILFLIIFEILRAQSTFEIRTVFMASIASLLYCWQIYELQRKRKSSPSTQLKYLQWATGLEIFFALGRIVILIMTAFTIRQVEQIPQLLILFTIAQIVINTLSYIAIGNYWSERIAISSAKSEIENFEIKALLQERESLINSLLKANKTAATGALSASIAHELNQPLGASSLNIQYLQKKLADGELSPAIQKEILDSLLADNQRAANIIRTLRSVFADEKIDATKVNLGDLIDDVLRIASPEIKSKQIHVELTIAPSLILHTNRSEIQQVLLNLLNNAIQALNSSSQAHKKIVIEGRHTVNGIEISIADNGDGISAETQAHLFELLAESQKQGMGLGLWLCKHIIMRHGGSIWFEPHATGGAKFLFQLPNEAQF